MKDYAENYDFEKDYPALAAYLYSLKGLDYCMSLKHNIFSQVACQVGGFAFCPEGSSAPCCQTARAEMSCGCMLGGKFGTVVDIHATDSTSICHCGSLDQIECSNLSN